MVKPFEQCSTIALRMACSVAVSLYQYRRACSGGNFRAAVFSLDSMQPSRPPGQIGRAGTKAASASLPFRTRIFAKTRKRGDTTEGACFPRLGGTEGACFPPLGRTEGACFPPSAYSVENLGKICSGMFGDVSL